MAEHKATGGLWENNRGKHVGVKSRARDEREKKTRWSVFHEWILSIETIWSFFTSARLKRHSALKVVFLTGACSTLYDTKSAEAKPKHNNWRPPLCFFSLLSRRSRPCVFVDLRFALGPQAEKWLRVEKGRACGVIAHILTLFIYLFSPFVRTKALETGVY